MEYIDVSVGLDDHFHPPIDNVVIQSLENQFARLDDRNTLYSAQNVPRRNALIEELCTSGIRFN